MKTFLKFLAVAVAVPAVAFFMTACDGHDHDNHDHDKDKHDHDGHDH